MKNILLAALGGMAIGVGMMAVAAPVHDWHAIDLVHQHILDALKDMKTAAAENNYDMSGHARKAEALLRDAEVELKLAVDSAKNAK